MAAQEKWEYTIEPFNTNATPNEELEAQVDRLGRSGWEVCFPWPSPAHLLFKRRLKK